MPPRRPRREAESIDLSANRKVKRARNKRCLPTPVSPPPAHPLPPLGSPFALNDVGASAVASYNAEYQEVFDRAKSYLHLWLVIDDAFPTPMRRETIIKSSIDHANMDLTEFPDNLISDAIHNSLCDHVYKVRNEWKAYAQLIVQDVYDLKTDNDPKTNKTRAEWLIKNERWIYGVSKPAVGSGQKAKQAYPFSNPAIEQVIVECAFENQHGVARLRPDKLRPIPLPMLAFAALVLRNALDEYTETGIRAKVKMDAKSYMHLYHTLMESVLQFDKQRKKQSLELRMDIWEEGSTYLHHSPRLKNEFVFDNTDSEEEGLL